MPRSNIRRNKGTRSQRAQERNYVRDQLGLSSKTLSKSERPLVRDALAQLRRKREESGKRTKVRLPTYKDLPDEAHGYRFILELFLKHAVKNGRVKGTLLEIGPGAYGGLIPFLLTDPFFRAQGRDFVVHGIQKDIHTNENYGPHVASRITIASVHDVVNEGITEIADFMVGSFILDSPRVPVNTREHTFNSMAQILKKGGKMFLEVGEEHKLPTKEAIEKAGLKLIDSHIDQKYDDYIYVLERVK